MSASTLDRSQAASTFQRRGLSLRSRLALTILTATLISFAIVALGIQDRARDALTLTASGALKSSTTALKDNVQTWLDLNVKALKTLAAQPAIISMDPAQQKPYLQAMQQAFALQGDQPATYLVSTTDDNGLNVARSDDTKPTDYSSREWFQGARAGQAPSFQTVIGATSKRPALVAATPIMSNNQIIGVAMFASELPSIKAAVNANRVGETGQVYVIDSQARPIAVTDPTVPTDKVDPVDYLPIVQVLRSGTRGLYNYTDANGEHWDAYLESLPNSWGIIVQQKESEFLGPLHDFQNIALIIFGLGATILTVLTWFLIGRALNPISEVAAEATAAAGGNLNVVVPVRRHDEVGALAFAFNMMIDRLREFIGTLEQRINARTEQLRASAEVGRAAVSILDTNQLLREIVNLVTDRFGFYYTAVFLADNTNRWAVLREATGEAGRILKERKHQLEIGGQSMVGMVMKTRQARIALDVGDEAVRFANPLLPDTRSEIALPLMVGTRVIGALDVQSTQAAAFDEASAAVLQSMADQIAIALSNTLQFQQAQAALQRTRQLYEASTAISNAEDADSVLRELMTEAVSDASAAQILTYGPLDEAGQYAYLEVAASWATSDGMPRLPIGTRVLPEQTPPISAWAVEPYIIRDAADPSVPPEQQQIMQAMGMLAMLGYALVAGSQPVGLLLIGYREPHMFTPVETQPLLALAGQIAVTLRNQQLVHEQRIARQQLDEINRRLTGQVWQQYTRERGQAVRKVDVGPGVQSEFPTVAELTAPVLIHGQEVGRLRLEDATPDREWKPNEKALIEAVAGEVAIAIENARLIEQTERRAQREQTISAITSQIYAATDVKKVLQITAEELRRATGSARAVVKLGRADLQADGSVSQSVPSNDGDTIPSEDGD
ncbi:MAG TPA: GAF domain-containing protein [Anaerolineae bacterium]|nr:GAF domain-containing protein [Anaerolineae bacterium]